MRRLIPVAVVAALLTSPVVANGPLVRNRPETFDVAGVALGMSPAQTQAAMAKLGARPVSEPAYDYAGQIADRVAMIQHRNRQRLPLRSMERLVVHTGGPGGAETFSVQFRQEPDGARAYHISYETPWPDKNPDHFIDAITAKYGQPSSITGSPGYIALGYSSTSSKYDQSHPFMLVDFNGGTGKASFTLDEGMEANTRYDQRFNDAAVTAANKSAGKPVF